MASEAVTAWLAIVDDDLRQVVNNLHGPLPSLAGAAYHCQQAAEKLVKAVLVDTRTAFSKTHDIGALVGLLPVGVAYRYPAEDVWDIPSAAMIETWKATIEEIRQSL